MIVCEKQVTLVRQVSRTSQQALKYLEQDTRVQQASPYKNLPVLSSNLYSSSPNKYANNQNNPIMGQFVYTSNTSQVCLVLVAFAINLAALPLQCGFLRLPEGSLDFVSWHHPRSFHPSFLSSLVPFMHIFPHLFMSSLHRIR